MPSGETLLAAMLGFFLIILYLWAKVQIEEVMRENNQLTQKKLFLEQKADDLKVQINALMSYERISKCAREKGLIPVRSRDIGELPVDLSGLPVYTVMPRAGRQEAGIQPIPIHH